MQVKRSSESEVGFAEPITLNFSDPDFRGIEGHFYEMAVSPSEGPRERFARVIFDNAVPRTRAEFVDDSRKTTGGLD